MSCDRYRSVAAGAVLDDRLAARPISVSGYLGFYKSNKQLSIGIKGKCLCVGKANADKRSINSSKLIFCLR